VVGDDTPVEGEKLAAELYSEDEGTDVERFL
jgi:hypothetical protein